MIDSANHDTDAQWYNNGQTPGGDYPRPGDVIYASVQNVNSDHLIFDVVNQTKGYNDAIPIGSGGYYLGTSLTQYIDSRTSEYITENSGGNHPFLRKPHLWNTWMFWEYADTKPLENFSRFGLDEWSNALGRYMQQIETYPPTAGWTGTQNFYNQWENCW